LFREADVTMALDAPVAKRFTAVHLNHPTPSVITRHPRPVWRCECRLPPLFTYASAIRKLRLAWPLL
jgi:hypothetical protein